LERRLLATDLVERDLSGAELSRRSFGEGSVFLSPAGDRLVTLANNSLVDLGSGKVMPLEMKSDSTGSLPVFSARGGMVLVGDGVFRTADGARVSNINPEGRLGMFGGSQVALAADGRHVVRLGSGRASLLDVEAKGVRAALGPPLAPSMEGDNSGVTDLAISRDGKLLIYNISSQGAFAIQVAPKLADSQMLWHTRVELSMSVDVTNDGSLVTVGGDGRAIFDGLDGHAIWRALPPPPSVSLDVNEYCLLDRLRFSPKATWLASSDYSRDLQVFKMGAEPPWQPFLELEGGCDAAAFSRDERLMATSAAALYRTGASPDAWSRVWSQPLSTTPGVLGYPINDIAFSPDDTQLLVSRCADRNGLCTTTFLDAATGAVLRQPAELTGPHPVFSPDGSWVVAADQLLHLPSGRVRSLGAAASPKNPALFTPDGDIIAGAEDGSITRYCRNEGH
jgi:WD40 repeat protein